VLPLLYSRSRVKKVPLPLDEAASAKGIVIGQSASEAAPGPRAPRRTPRFSQCEVQLTTGSSPFPLLWEARLRARADTVAVHWQKTRTAEWAPVPDGRTCAAQTIVAPPLLQSPCRRRLGNIVAATEGVRLQDHAATSRWQE
jgi:hypothetical protein